MSREEGKDEGAWVEMQRQLILRIIPEDLAAQVRERLALGTIEGIDIQPEGGGGAAVPRDLPRRMQMVVDGVAYPASMVNLPCPWRPTVPSTG